MSEPKSLISTEIILENIENWALFLLKLHLLHGELKILQKTKIPTLGVYPTILLYQSEAQRHQTHFHTYLQSLSKENVCGCASLGMELYLTDLKRELLSPKNKPTFDLFKKDLTDKIKQSQKEEKEEAKQ